MARIPMLREDDPDTPPEAREFLKRVESGLGEVFNAVRLLANHPRQANALISFVRSVRYGNSLTPALTELAYTTASVVKPLPLLSASPRDARSGHRDQRRKVTAHG